MYTLRRILLASALCLMLPRAMAAGTYPSHPLVLINPYAVGGPADLLGRALARELGEVLGQSVIVENKPGGGASIGTAYVAGCPRPTATPCCWGRPPRTP